MDNNGIELVAMKNIANKYGTLRTAKASAIVRTTPKTVKACAAGKTPKGNVIDVARVAGIMAAKRTPDIIPYCHPIPIDHVGIEITCKGRDITITSSITAVAKTGVEMEALTSASVAALTVYDMLKPIEKNIVISEIRLLEKHGGKSDFVHKISGHKRAAILIPSDGVLNKKYKDKTGPFIYATLKSWNIGTLAPKVVPNDALAIEEALRKWCDQGINLVITSGGTGIGPRDKTVEATRNVIDRELPGIAEALRMHGIERTPYAALSGGIAGASGKTLIINLPGSPKAVAEYLEILAPIVAHAFEMIAGKGHRRSR